MLNFTFDNIAELAIYIDAHYGPVKDIFYGGKTKEGDSIYTFRVKRDGQIDYIVATIAEQNDGSYKVVSYRD